LYRPEAPLKAPGKSGPDRDRQALTVIRRR